MSRAVRSEHWWGGWMTSGDLRPWPATLIGVVGVAIVEVLLGPLIDVGRATQAVGLVVPVIAAAVIGGRRPAYAVAGIATLAFSLLIPPIGSPKVDLAEDLVALCVFSAVAVAVSTVVARRLELLSRVDRQRRVLLRSVSHDLRTPLSSIEAASSELLSDAVHDEATRRRLLELIGVESRRLDRLVANLLDLSRIEAGAVTLQRQWTDVHELVETSESRLASLFTDVTLSVEIDPDVPLVNVDFVLMTQVLVNLLENAERHSPPGGEVAFSARVDGRHVVMEVADQGPGVDADSLELIFEPFRTGTISGTSGVGLAICKAVVESHGGTISVREADSGGARFSIGIPLA